MVLFSVTKAEKETLEKLGEIMTRPNGEQFFLLVPCQFWSKQKHHCTIHEQKPEHCRKYACNKMKGEKH